MTLLRRRMARLLAVGLAALVPALAAGDTGRCPIPRGILAEPDALTPEVSTEELIRILAEGRVPVLDVRSAREYAIAHIPGSINLWEKEVEQVAARYPDRTTPLVLYCNGPYCQKSRRLSAALVERGYKNVRRYQLGLPVWRALGHTVQTDMEGLKYVTDGDRTAVFVDARSTPAEALGLPGVVRIRKGEADAANEDGRLPHRDKGTRVIVFGADAGEARTVADEIARKAYWNSSFFGGTAEQVHELLRSARAGTDPAPPATVPVN